MADMPQLADGQDEPGEMMALLNDSLFEGFDGMPMNLDSDLDLMGPSTAFEGLNTLLGPEPSGASHAGMSAQQQSQYSTIDDGTMTLRNGIGGVGSSSVAQTTSSIGAAGQQPTFPGGSTVTEFTKRRNWPAKVVEELKDLLQILDADGRIRYVSPNVNTLTGYGADELRDTLLRDLIHPDDVGVFVAEMNESIASGAPLRMFYRFKKRNGNYAVFETVGHAHIAAPRFATNPHNQSPFCQAVFFMSRPYPTRNAALLDSFLEHKMENERLRQRIAELRNEEEADAEDAQRQWMSQEGRSEGVTSEDTGAASSVTTTSPFLLRTGISGQPATGSTSSGADGSMPPPERRPSFNAALTRENLEGAVAGSRPDSLRDKMARYEGANSHAETIEMLTGLRYIEGERSRGITTGNTSPALIKGDAGIAIPLDRDPRTGEKTKKKLKTSEEYVCTDCGTLDSPEWRKGPSGPKTLCNACGLRWAKKEKKRSSGHANTNGTPAAARDTGIS